jgi:hypothetical protein
VLTDATEQDWPALSLKTNWKKKCMAWQCAQPRGISIRQERSGE